MWVFDLSSGCLEDDSIRIMQRVPSHVKFTMQVNRTTVSSDIPGGFQFQIKSRGGPGAVMAWNYDVAILTIGDC